jgi:hypothetical protein
MRDLDRVVRAGLDEWRPEAGAGDWADVLARAGRSGESRRNAIRPTSARARWTALAAGAMVLVALLSVPEFGIGAQLKTLLTGSGRPGLQLGTTLVRADGTRVGSFSARTSRLFVTVAGDRKNIAPHPFSRAGERPLGGAPITWALELARPASEGVMLERVNGRRRAVVGRLCKPCGAEEKGMLRLSRSALSALFGRGLVVAVTTSRGTARGVVRLQLPRRR